MNRNVNMVAFFGVIMYYVFILIWICNFDVDFVQKYENKHRKNAPYYDKKVYICTVASVNFREHLFVLFLYKCLCFTSLLLYTKL